MKAKKLIKRARDPAAAVHDGERVRAVLALDSWAGRTEHPVEIVGETPKRYRVRILEDWLGLPSRRVASRGDVVLVPKYAVRILREGEDWPHVSSGAQTQGGKA